MFSIAYFFSTPGEHFGLAVQRWLVNGNEPQDPHERGARMGQFLAMLHGFMALQTGWCFYKAISLTVFRYNVYGRKTTPRSV